MGVDCVRPRASTSLPGEADTVRVSYRGRNRSPVGGAAADLHPQIYAFVFIALHTAMRASEVLGLRREFVDLDKCVIHLSTSKTGARDVPISANLRQFLDSSIVRTAVPESGWLFPSSTSASGHGRGPRAPAKNSSRTRALRGAASQDTRYGTPPLRIWFSPALTCRRSRRSLATKPSRWSLSLFAPKPAACTGCAE